MPTGRGEANLIVKCKCCERVSSADLVKGGAGVGLLHFGSKKTAKISRVFEDLSRVFEDLSRNSVFFFLNRSSALGGGHKGGCG